MSKFDIPSKGLDKIPDKGIKVPTELKPVNEPTKPEPDVSLAFEQWLGNVWRKTTNFFSNLFTVVKTVSSSLSTIKVIGIIAIIIILLLIVLKFI